MVEIGQRTALASDVDLIGRASVQDEAVGRVQFDHVGQQRFPVEEVARRPGSLVVLPKPDALDAPPFRRQLRVAAPPPVPFPNSRRFHTAVPISIHSASLASCGASGAVAHSTKSSGGTADAVGQQGPQMDRRRHQHPPARKLVQPGRDVAGIERASGMQRQAVLKRQQDHRFKPVHVLMRHGPDQESPSSPAIPSADPAPWTLRTSVPQVFTCGIGSSGRAGGEGDGGHLIFRKGRDLRGDAAAANGLGGTWMHSISRIRYAGVCQADRSGIASASWRSMAGMSLGGSRLTCRRSKAAAKARPRSRAGRCRGSRTCPQSGSRRARAVDRAQEAAHSRSGRPRATPSQHPGRRIGSAENCSCSIPGAVLAAPP